MKLDAFEENSQSLTTFENFIKYERIPDDPDLMFKLRRLYQLGFEMGCKVNNPRLDYNDRFVVVVKKIIKDLNKTLNADDLLELSRAYKLEAEV